MVQSFSFKQKVYKETRSSTDEIFETIFRPNQNGQMNKNQPTNKQTNTSILTNLQGAVELAGGGMVLRPPPAA